MVELLELPEEIIILIIKELDLCSLQNMYHTCSALRNIICMHGVVRECNMSMNIMATAKTLNLNLFKDIASHLVELNMCGVPDLYKTKLIPAFKKLKRLKILDISYTNLHILDLVDLHKICPTIKDITVDFVFGQPCHMSLCHKTVLKCQSLFEKFENIHFVGSLTNLLYSKLALNILEKSKLNILKFSIVEVDESHSLSTHSLYSECQIPQFNHFAIYLLNWKSTNTYECVSKFPVLSMIQFQSYEFFVIHMLSLFTSSVYGTQIFKHFFSENFNVALECITNYKKSLMGNVAFLIWNKETTNFNCSFFHKLAKRVKQYFPFFYDTDVPVPNKFDWFYTEPQHSKELMEGGDRSTNSGQIKKRRIALPNFVLNYDNVFKKKHKVELSLVFNIHSTAAIALSANCNYLRKLTYFSLSGPVCYSSDFFHILFQCCESLVTLNVEAPNISPCAVRICNSILLSQSLKNMRLVDKNIDLNLMFSSLSQCKTLENIHLLDHRLWDHSKIADPSKLLQNCDNLYSVFIEAPLAESAQAKLSQMFNKTKIRLGKYCLKVVINHKSINNIFHYNYQPYLGVFKLNPIKPT